MTTNHKPSTPLPRVTRKQFERLKAFANGAGTHYEGSWWHIATLVQHGYIKMTPGKPRCYGVEVTEKGRAFLRELGESK
jgi:predicted transcriptional regulator